MSLFFDTSIYPVKRYDYDTNGNLIYEGFTSSQISDINDPVWIILKYIYDSVNNRISTKIAEGDITNNKKWTDRKKYHYSNLIIIHNSNPIIDNIVWDNDNHYKNYTYILTIDAHDPDDTDTITYNVTCDDINVSIVQDTINDNIFTITYPNYSIDTNVIYTITVTDNNELNSIITDNKLVNSGLLINDTGIFAGGVSSNQYLSTIKYISISILSNAINFGNLTISNAYFAATSNGTNDRGVFGGGYNPNFIKSIDYITISTLGNASHFGNLQKRLSDLAAVSNGIKDRGVFGGGYDNHHHSKNDEVYITISTLGNAQNFGKLSVSRDALAATSNSTNDRGVFGGGYHHGQSNVIDYITIPILSNAIDFGDLTIRRYGLAATSNGTNDRGIFGGGWNNNYLNIIDYITISTINNALNFGDLTIERYYFSATSNGIKERGVFNGGYYHNYLNNIDYITISTLSNALDFGNLLENLAGSSATSNA